MSIIDVHSHINLLGDKAFSLIDNADNVSVVILNALDLRSYERMIDFRDKYYEGGGKKKIALALGLYPPSELKKDYEQGLLPDYNDNIDEVIARMKKDKKNLSAIGEIGIDGKASKEDFDNDRKIFKKLLGVADELSLPVIVHSRKAEKEVLEDIQNFKGSVVLHTFSGKKSLIHEAIKRKKVFFSIPCIVDHSQQFQDLISIVPLNRLLTETDSPFMPLKGKEYSEPNDINNTIKVIASIKGMNEKETAQVIMMNTKNIFSNI